MSRGLVEQEVVEHNLSFSSYTPNNIKIEQVTTHPKSSLQWLIQIPLRET